MTDEIVVLEGLEAVRRRPSLSIGDVADGMYTMLWKVIDNALDEQLRAGATGHIRISFVGDRAIVEDDGHGIEVEPEWNGGPSWIELVMTTFLGHGPPRKVARGRHQVILAPVCALSTRVDVEVWRGGRAYIQSFACGRALGPVEEVGGASRTGTRISFVPDFTIVARQVWDVERVVRRTREIAACSPGLTVIVEDDVIRYPSGGLDHVRYLGRERLRVEPVRLVGSRDGVEVEVVLAWTDDDDVRIANLANYGSTECGTHVDGMFVGLHATFARRVKSIGRIGTSQFRSIVERGIIALVHVIAPHPKYAEAAHTQLANPEIGQAVRIVVEEGLAALADENPALLDALLLRIGNTIG